MNSLVENLETRPNSFILLIGGYFLLNLIVRVCLPNSLEMDEAGQILMSQWYALGYDTQPPFFNWVQHAVIDGIGQSLFALSLVKNLFLFLSYIFYYLAARQVLANKSLAVAAALGLLTIPEIGWLAQRDLTHSNASLFAACLFLYGLFRTLDRPTVVTYLVTGIAIGIGLISKYNSRFSACVPSSRSLPTQPIASGFSTGAFSSPLPWRWRSFCRMRSGYSRISRSPRKIPSRSSRPMDGKAHSGRSPSVFGTAADRSQLLRADHCRLCVGCARKILARSARG